MEQNQSSSISTGSPCHDFKMLPEGQVICLTKPGKIYDLHELTTSFKLTGNRDEICYMIVTSDGVCGSFHQSTDE